MLSVKLNKRLGDFSLNMDFHLVERSICALFGPSGSGKSTLINCISGLLTPDDGHIVCEGEVWFDSEQGVNLPPERRETGYVFQDGFFRISTCGKICSSADASAPAKAQTPSTSTMPSICWA